MQDSDDWNTEFKERHPDKNWVWSELANGIAFAVLESRGLNNYPVKEIEQGVFWVTAPCHMIRVGTRERVMTMQTRSLPPGTELPEQKIEYLKKEHPGELILVKRDTLESLYKRVVMPDGSYRNHCSIRYAHIKLETML